MPSPTSSTLPTSLRSTSVRYLRISSSMTDAISSTLNLMKAPCLDFLSQSRLGNVGGAADNLARGPRPQRLAQILQPGRHAGVELLTLDVDHEATDQRRIDALDQRRFPARGGSHGILQPGALRVVQRHRRADVDVDPTPQVAQGDALGLGDGAGLAETLLAVAHLEQVEQQHV